MKISKFLGIVGFLMVAILMFYLPITYAFHLPLSDKFLWGLYGAVSMYAFISLTIRFLLLRKEDIPNYPPSRTTTILIATVALLAIGLVWGLYSIR